MCSHIRLPCFRSIQGLGYRILLDNIQPEECNSEFISVANFIKLDINHPETPVVMRKLFGRIDVIMSRVESEDAYNRATLLGAKYYQGFHFSHPNIVRGTKLPPLQSVVLDVLAMTVRDVELLEIESRLKTEPMLCFTLLRLVNSAGISAGRRVETLREAIMILGRKNLQRWLQILLFAQPPDMSSVWAVPLLQAATFRGRFMEYLAAIVQDTMAMQEKAFMVGILSYAQALLRVPLSKILASLNLSKEVEQALLNEEGALGLLLTLAKKLDEGNFQSAHEIVHALGFNYDQIEEGMVKSLHFSNAISSVGQV